MKTICLMAAGCFVLAMPALSNAGLNVASQTVVMSAGLTDYRTDGIDFPAVGSGLSVLVGSDTQTYSGVTVAPWLPTGVPYVVKVTNQSNSFSDTNQIVFGLKQTETINIDLDRYNTSGSTTSEATFSVDAPTMVHLAMLVGHSDYSEVLNFTLKQGDTTISSGFGGTYGGSLLFPTAGDATYDSVGRGVQVSKDILLVPGMPYLLHIEVGNTSDSYHRNGYTDLAASVTVIPEAGTAGVMMLGGALAFLGRKRTRD